MRFYTKDTQEMLSFVDKTHPTNQDIIKREVPELNLKSSAKPGMKALENLKAERERIRKIRDVLDSYARRVRIHMLEKYNGKYEVGYPTLLKWALRKEEKTQKACDEERIKKVLAHHNRIVPLINYTESKISIRAERQARKDLIEIMISKMDELPVTYENKTILFHDLKEILEDSIAEKHALEFHRFNAIDFCHKVNIPIPEFLTTNLLGLDPRNKDINNLSPKAIEKLSSLCVIRKLVKNKYKPK